MPTPQQISELFKALTKAIVSKIQGGLLPFTNNAEFLQVFCQSLTSLVL